MFYCAICTYCYITPIVVAVKYEDALDIAQREARLHFNRCLCCGEWVCDHHYNENLMLCVRCEKDQTVCNTVWQTWGAPKHCLNEKETGE